MEAIYLPVEANCLPVEANYLPVVSNNLHACHHLPLIILQNLLISDLAGVCKLSFTCVGLEKVWGRSDWLTGHRSYSYLYNQCAG